MGTFKKLFLLSVLGLGLFSEKLFADEKVDGAIFSIVSKALDNKKITKKVLLEILKHLKSEIMIVIENQPEPEYQKLYKDLQRLTFGNLVAEYWQIMEVINLLPEKSKIYVEEKINDHIRGMSYWRKKALCLLLKIDLPEKRPVKNG